MYCKQITTNKKHNQMSSTFAINAKNIHNFNEYVYDKMLNLGFLVFGGVPRNITWKKLHESERRKQNVDYLSLIWEKTFSSETWYNRRGEINDIDCIGTYSQFEELTGSTMMKYGDIKFSVVEKELKYPIPGLTIEKGTLEIFTVKAKSKILNQLLFLTHIDIFVCKPEKLQWLYKILGQQLDFACNGLCVQKLNGQMTISVLSGGCAFEHYEIYEQMKKDEAILCKRKVEKPMFHRVCKMLGYGWYVQVGAISHRQLYLEDKKLFVFGRYSSNTVRCKICKMPTRDSSDSIYIKIDNLVMYHLSCYITKSIACYEVINDTTFPVIEPVVEPVVEPSNESVEPDLVEPIDIIVDPVTSSTVVAVPSDIDSSTTVVVNNEYVPNSVEDENNYVSDEEAEESDDTAELNAFIAFTRSRDPPPSSQLNENTIQVIGDVLFHDGIAQNVDRETLEHYRQLQYPAGNSIADAHRITVEFCLCSYAEHLDILITLRELLEHYVGTHVQVLRP